jgi:hypothetical protein
MRGMDRMKLLFTEDGMKTMEFGYTMSCSWSDGYGNGEERGQNSEHVVGTWTSPRNRQPL